MSNLALIIGASGIDAQQAAMDTVAENLSNANTPGYISESPDLVTSPGLEALGVGSGVITLPPTQNSDELLQIGSEQASGALSQASALQQVLTGLQASFPVSTTEGLSNDLSNFWNSWDTLAQNPSNTSDASAVVDNAQTLVTDLSSSSSQIATTSADAQSQLGSLAAQDNSVLAQVAALNRQIVATQGSGESPNALVDQQNQLMNQLASDLGAVGTTQPNGTLTVAIGGVDVVSGTTAASLQITGSAGTLALTTASGTAVPATAGTASGLLAAVNQYLPSYQSQLDSVANALASTVNTQLEAGYTTSGVAGTGLFEGSGAAGLSLSSAIVSDPSQLAISSSATDAANNGANAQAMADLYDSPTGPDAEYQNFIQNMGSQISGVKSQVETATSVANAAQENLQSVTGVDTNSQMVLMLSYQESYEASAKVISAADQMVQSLLQAT